MGIAVGESLGKIARGEVYELTRDEIFGLTNRRFLRQHGIDLAFADTTASFVQHAVRSRNSTHPHVKKLGLSKIMVSHNDALKSLYQDVASKIIRYFEANVHGKTKGMAYADENDDGFDVSDIEKEAFLANVEATLKQSKNPFNNLSAKYIKESYGAGHSAGGSKIAKTFGVAAPSMDDARAAGVVDGYASSESSYYDGLLDDIHDDVRQSMDQKAGTKDDFVTALAAGVMGQFYRTDLFTSDLYRVAQDGQLNTFDRASQDNAGLEWKYKWRAVIDGLTCDECTDLNDGPARYLDDFEYDPGDVHFFCRCDLDPIPPDEDDEDGQDGGGPDGDAPGLFDNPNNTDYDPDSDLDESLDDDVLDVVPKDDSEANYLLANLHPDHFENYAKSSSFLEKVGDLQTGNVAGLKMKNMANLADTHFSKKHGARISGAWSNREWWDRLDGSKKMKNEIDMLGRIDAHLGALDGTKRFEELKADGHHLSFSRDLNRPDNAAYYNINDGTIHIHNGTMDHDHDAKNEILSHEMGHWVDFKSKTNGPWDDMMGKWDAATAAGKRAGEQAYVSNYGRQFAAKNRGSRTHMYAEDFADAFSYYMHQPYMFKGSPTLKAKYDLLKTGVFGDKEFVPAQFKSLL